MAEFADKLLSIGILTGSAKNISDVLKLNPVANGHVNQFANGSTVIINSDRIIMNSKKDHLFISGKEGVTITTPGSVHIDCVDDLYMFSESGEIYLGLPNRGQEYDYSKQVAPTDKSKATINYPYEPVLLGLKTANLIEDLLSLLAKAVIRTPAGDGYFSKEMMYNFEMLRSRLPEIMSTVVFVDGVTHEKPDPSPPIPEDIATSVAASTGSAGSTVSNSTATNTGTNLNNTQSPATNAAGSYATGSVPSTNPDGKITITGSTQ
jgi:hypothetical protein